MRFVGLSICLLVSALSARAEALEAQVSTLEERIKSLEGALGNPGDVEERDATTPALSTKETHQ